MDDVIEIGRRVLEEESRAVGDLAQHIGTDFKAAVELIYSSSGTVVVTGMGKSGLIGRKIAATLTSTGTRSMFLHPEEGMHGDLGIVSSNDVCLMISHSGVTRELTRLVPSIRRIGARIVAITSNDKSTLAKKSDIHLSTHVESEACPFNLVPTTSSTVTLALGDALAIALLEKRGFAEEDFALLHPGGNLGKRLTLKVEDIMFVKDEIVLAQVDTPVRDILFRMTEKKQGFAAIVDDNLFILGIITDGDIRRAVLKQTDLWNTECQDLMSSNPTSIRKEILVVDALKLMKEKQISCLLVQEEKRIVGAIDVQEITRTGIRI